MNAHSGQHKPNLRRKKEGIERIRSPAVKCDTLKHFAIATANYIELNNILLKERDIYVTNTKYHMNHSSRLRDFHF